MYVYIYIYAFPEIQSCFLSPFETSFRTHSDGRIYFVSLWFDSRRSGSVRILGLEDGVVGFVPIGLWNLRPKKRSNKCYGCFVETWSLPEPGFLQENRQIWGIFGNPFLHTHERERMISTLAEMPSRMLRTRPKQIHQAGFQTLGTFGLSKKIWMTGWPQNGKFGQGTLALKP